MTSDILKRAAEVQAEAKAYFEANGIVVTDPGLVPELIVEIERLTARAEAAEAQVAYAGAVMVEAAKRAVREECWPEDGTYPPEQRDIEDAERGTVEVATWALDALPTLSPIAAAAGMVADAIDADMRTFNQCLDEEPATEDMKVGHFFAQVMRRYARALAEQEKADG